MSVICDIFVRGDPKAQPRQRHFAMKTKGGGYTARSYDPGTAEGWKSQIAVAIREHLPTTPYDEPLRVDLDFYFKRPKRLLRRQDPDGPIPFTSKPDRDNLDKAVLDALTQCGFWADDALACGGEVWKWYARKDGPAGARIKISTLEAEAPGLVAMEVGEQV